MQYCCINMYILWVWHKILTLTFSIFHVTLFGVILHLSVIVLLLTVSFVDRLAVTSVYYVFCIVSLNSRTVIVRILPSRLHFPRILSYAHTHTHPFNSPLSGTTQVGRYLKGKTNLDFTEARDSEWQLHQLDHMQVCTSLQADNHTPPLSFLQAGCPSCHPTNSVKALKA